MTAIRACNSFSAVRRSAEWTRSSIEWRVAPEGLERVGAALGVCVREARFQAEVGRTGVSMVLEGLVEGTWEAGRVVRHAVFEAGAERVVVTAEETGRWPACVHVDVPGEEWSASIGLGRGDDGEARAMLLYSRCERLVAGVAGLHAAWLERPGLVIEGTEPMSE